MRHLLCAALSSVLFPVYLSDASLSYSNSLFPVFLCAAVFFLLRTASRCGFSRRKKTYAFILGSLFSVMTAFGYSLTNREFIAYTNPLFLVSIACYAYLFAQIIGLLWTFLERIGNRLCVSSDDALSPASGRLHKLSRVIRFILDRPLLIAGLLLLFWAPCYISTFPGNFVYDASYEYYQRFDGYTRSYPMLHSVIITRLLYASELLTGSFNPGIGLYTIVQMLLMAALFAHILHKFYTFSIHPLLLGALAAYYAAFPVIHFLVTCTTRDVMFSALLTWAVYLFYLLSRDPQAFMSSIRRVLLLASVLVFTLLSRNNNSGPLVLCLLCVVCVLIVVSFGRKHIRNSILFTGYSLGLFCAVSALLVALCQPLYDSPPASSMSIITQPIARAYMLHKDEWTEEERAEFESYFNMETLEYFPQNADPSKGNLMVRYANMREFLSFWVHIGLKHPACYLDAVFANTMQMWFPGCVLDGYTVRGMFPAYEKNYFYFGKYIEEIGSRMNLLPGVFKFYEDIGLRISFEKIPLISMMFSVGFHVWILLHAVFFALYKKSRALFWPLTLLTVYTLCSAFVPLVLLRYFGALFLSLPMLVIFTLHPVLPASTEMKSP